MVKNVVELTKKAKLSKEKEDKEALERAYNDLKLAFWDVSGKDLSDTATEEAKKEFEKENDERDVVDSLEGKDISVFESAEEFKKVKRKEFELKEYSEILKEVWERDEQDKYKDLSKAELSAKRKAWVADLEQKRKDLKQIGFTIPRGAYYEMMRYYKPEEIKKNKE